jgi:RHS repeat-associated protein
MWRRRSLTWSQRLALGLPLVLTAALIVSGQNAAVAAPPAKAASAVSCPASRPDEQAALVTARLCKGTVAVDDATTESSLTWANQDGTLSTQMDGGPVRLRQPDGTWTPIDSSLSVGGDGVVRAAAHPDDLDLFGGDTAATRQTGGDRALVSAARPGSQRITMDWKTALPTPTLSGNTATYSDVQPGVDLVVQLTATGFRQHTVLKTRPGKAVSFTVPIRLNGLTARRAASGGGIELVDTNGKVAGSIAQPSMWGAQLDAVSQLPARTAAVDYTLTTRAYGVDVTITPDLAFLSNPATTYPVTIDPDINFKGTFDTYVQQGTTTDNSAATELAVGTDASGNPARAYINWDPAPLRGAQIIEAHLGLWNTYSATCADRAIDVYSAGLATTATRWVYSGAGTTGRPTTAATKSASTSGSKGQASCAAGYIYTPSHALDALAQTWADTTSGQVGMGLQAPSETDVSYFKRVSSGDATSGKPFMYVTYNAPPTTSALATSPSTPCTTGTSRPYLNSTTPQLQARLTDPEGAAVRPRFEWYTLSGTLVGSIEPTPSQASGSILATTIPAGALTDASSYYWRVRAFDGNIWGPWSSNCEFTVDTTVPTAAPAVTSTAYPVNAWAGAAGTAGTFTFGAAGTTDIAAYVYGLDTTVPSTSVNAASLGGTATVSVTPTADGPHTLVVKARDRGGNLSPATTYAFNVGKGAVVAPKIGDISAGKVVLQAQAPTPTTGVTFQWRRADTDAWTTIPAGDVITESGGAAITWPVAPTPAGSGSYPRLVWNLEKTVNDAEAGPDALDGSVQIHVVMTGGSGGTSSTVAITLDRNRASAATDDVGPGSVNLLTGNLTVSDTDASIDSYGSDLTVGRSYNTRLASATDAANMFGPGWVSSAIVDDADANYTGLTRTGNLIQIAMDDGDTTSFTAKTTTSFTPEVGDEDLQLAYAATPDTYTLTDGAGTTVDFTKLASAAAGIYQPTKVTQTGSGQSTTLTWQKVTIAGVDRYRPMQMLAPVPAGVTCATLVRGCRALAFTYATATGTTAATWGDYLGRVTQIAFTAWDPDLATPAMRTVVMAKYSYDSTGQLRAAWDPRLDYTDAGGTHHLQDTYAYNSDGILSTITPNAQQPWQLAYTTVPGDVGKGRLATVTRSALTAGTNTTTVVYKVPTTSSGPNDLSQAQTSRWGQPIAPVDATAIYPGTQIPDGNQATGVLPSSAERAAVSYFDANGQTVDSATPGGHISATWYDQYGNEIQSLDDNNRRDALSASTTDSPAQEAALASRLSMITTYSSDGQRLLDTLSPEHDVVLSDWSTVRGRTHIHNVYDEGAPVTGNPYNLVTTSTTSARYQVNGVDVDADGRTTTTGYDWTLRQPTTSTVDPGGLNLVSSTAYDSATGLVTVITSPGGAGSTTTPSTHSTVYYRAGTGSGASECDSHPEWANLPCRIQFGLPDSGAELPITVMTYDIYNQVRISVEKTSTGTVLRTATTTYDTAGRAYDSSVTTAAGLGTSVPITRNIYDQATGQAVRTQSIVSGAVAGELVRGYDGLGEQTSYTDADGVTSATSYDLLGRPATSTDGKATRTYTYDGGTERRGVLTQVVDSQAGTFTGSYDNNGNLSRETWPNAVIVNHYYNETGDDSGIEYVTTDGCSASSCTLFYDYTGQDAQGKNRWDSSAFDSFGYVYDNAGRLTDAEHTTLSGCTLHDYTLNAAGDHTGLTTYGPTAGSCTTDTPTSQRTWTYDTADRATNTGYTYDALGRTLTIPSTDTANGAGNATIGYHSTDLVDTIAQNGRTTDYTLDVNNERIRSWTDTTTGTAAHLNHYDSDDDSPSWTQENTSTFTRPFDGVSDLAGIYSSGSGTISYQLTNLHGDVAATMQTIAGGLTSTSTTDEYGNPTNPAAAGTTRYGWLGSKQRAADTPAGLILMGVRLFNTYTGRFLQTDPVPGGSCNAYDYACGDPVNGLDLDGKSWWRKAFRVAAIVGGIAGGIACGLSVVCGIAVGAAAGLAAYSAMHAGTRSWSWRRAGYATLGGAASGVGVGRFGRYIKNGNNYVRFGRAGQYNHLRASLGPARNHWRKLSPWKRWVFRHHIHVDQRYGGIDNWRRGTNRTWWRRY